LRRIGLGVGLIATVLIPVALSFFGVLGGKDAVAAILLLSGAWAFVFGLFAEAKQERLYTSGFGALVAILSTFIVIHLRYTIGLFIVALVALALIQALTRPGGKRPSVPQAGQGP
jgi:hypothetical protein